MLVDIKNIKKKFLENKIVNYKIVGTSMSPFYCENEIVTITKNSDRLKIGECYLFYYRYKLIFHRLIKIKNRQYYFVGDNSIITQTIEKKDIIGEPYRKTPLLHRFQITIVNNFFLSNSPKAVIRNYIRRRIFLLLWRLL